MKTLIFAIVFLFGFALGVNGQGVVVDEDTNVTLLMQKFITKNNSVDKIDGWRIQLVATTDRGKVEHEMIRFRSLFPNIQVNWIHSQPYYKLRAGAFLTKLDAIKLLYVVKSEYPGAYPTKAKISPQELLEN